jgi:triacylglycerol lipase
MYISRWLSRLPLLLLTLLVAACERAELPTGVPDGPRLARPSSPGGGGGDDGSTAPSERDPILFVHGYNSDGSTWNTMVGRFKKDGWTDSELYAWTYDYTQSNVDIAAALAAEVQRIRDLTGAAKVDIATHSMGGLSSRHYLKHYDDPETADIEPAPVDAWVSLGGPNHGTTTAEACSDVSCVEMRIDSEFLNALNANDETPNSARYGTWWSPCDEVIDPNDSVVLQASDAANHKTSCMPHRQLKEDSKVYRAVRDFVATAP